MENTVKHTPGPWVASGVMVGDTTDTLGGMFRIKMPEDQFAFCTNEHDKRLIAAAPELLEACAAAYERLLEEMVCECGEGRHSADCVIGKLERALARAPYHS